MLSSQLNCGCPQGHPSPQSATSQSRAGAFWASLHHRIADQIAWAPIRGWIHAHAYLEPSERHGWPVLLLVLEAPPPPELFGGAETICFHYRKALANSTGKAGPLADLARSLELRQEAGR